MAHLREIRQLPDDVLTVAAVRYQKRAELLGRVQGYLVQREPSLEDGYYACPRGVACRTGSCLCKALGVVAIGFGGALLDSSCALSFSNALRNKTERRRS